MSNTPTIDEMRATLRDLYGKNAVKHTPDAVITDAIVMAAKELKIPMSDITQALDAAQPLSSAPMAGNLRPGLRRAYVLAGDATFTVRSTRTGDRFTFKVQKAEDSNPPMYFVKVLTNADEYKYIGCIFATGFRTTRKSAFQLTAPCVRAFGWFITQMETTLAEVWHEGRCGRCGRVLTVPESIESGIGPVCAEKG